MKILHSYLFSFSIFFFQYGSVPKTMNEKEEFKNFIKSFSRCFEKEENFQEAVQNQHLAYTPQCKTLINFYN